LGNELIVDFEQISREIFEWFPYGVAVFQNAADQLQVAPDRFKRREKDEKAILHFMVYKKDPPDLLNLKVTVSDHNSSVSMENVDGPVGAVRCQEPTSIRLYLKLNKLNLSEKRVEITENIKVDGKIVLAEHVRN
jgi:hypothetical protein